jgi:hypothetical protein
MDYYESLVKMYNDVLDAHYVNHFETWDPDIKKYEKFNEERPGRNKIKTFKLRGREFGIDNILCLDDIYGIDTTIVNHPPP